MTGSPHAWTRLAAESAPAGARLHAIGDQGVPFRRIAETTGHHLDMPARTSSAAEAEARHPVRPGSPGQPHLERHHPRSSLASTPPTRTCSPTSTRGTTPKPDMVLTAAALPSLHGRHGGRTRTHALKRHVRS